MHQIVSSDFAQVSTNVQMDTGIVQNTVVFDLLYSPFVQQFIGSDQTCKMECRKYRRRCKTTARTNFQACAKDCEQESDSRCEEGCSLSLEKCLEQCDIRHTSCELGCSSIDRTCILGCQRQSETCAGSCDISFHSCTDVSLHPFSHSLFHIPLSLSLSLS